MTDRDRQQRLPVRPRLAPLILAVISMTALAAGCGGSANSRSGTTSGSVPAKFRHQVDLALQYSNCMRTHGVPNFADPKISVSGTELFMQNPQMSATEVASPAYQSASGACAKYLPQQPQTPGTTGAGNSQQQAVRFADCMRAHGVPNFPDPTTGGAFKLGSAINPRTPAFIAAMDHCRTLRPSTLKLSS